MKVQVYLEITMKIKESDRAQAAKVYTDYRAPFLKTIDGALTKDLLIRDADVQVLHGFDSKENAEKYVTIRKQNILCRRKRKPALIMPTAGKELLI